MKNIDVLNPMEICALFSNAIDNAVIANAALSRINDMIACVS